MHFATYLAKIEVNHACRAIVVVLRLTGGKKPNAVSSAAAVKASAIVATVGTTTLFVRKKGLSDQLLGWI
jgi:hypothetical protein